jgi:hypothetical protein
MRSRDLDLDFTNSDVTDKAGVLRLVLRRDFAFSDQGICKFEVENRSSRVNNPGINSIQIILEKTQ